MAAEGQPEAIHRKEHRLLYGLSLVLTLVLKGRKSQDRQRRQRLRHQVDTVDTSVAKTVRKAESLETPSSYRSAMLLFLMHF